MFCGRRRGRRKIKKKMENQRKGTLDSVYQIHRRKRKKNKESKKKEN